MSHQAEDAENQQVHELPHGKPGKPMRRCARCLMRAGQADTWLQESPRSLASEFVSATSFIMNNVHDAGLMYKA